MVYDSILILIDVIKFIAYVSWCCEYKGDVIAHDFSVANMFVCIPFLCL